MVSNNAKNVIKQVLASCDTVGLLTATDVGGVTRYIADFTAFPAVVEDTFTLTAANAGISVGSGSTTPSAADYQLASTITSGLTGTVAMTKEADVSGNASITFSVELTNTSGSDITISEIGYKQEISASDSLNGTTATDRVFLLDRSTFETITLAPNAQAVIDYTLKAVITNNGGAEGTKTITQNGTYNAIDDNLDGYSSVTVNVSGSATLGTKTITQNGIYNASADNFDGYSQVTVNVSGGGGGGNLGIDNVICTTALPIGQHKILVSNSSPGQIGSTFVYSTSKVTTIPANTGSYYLVVAAKNTVDEPYISAATNATWAYIGSTVYSSYNSELFLVTKVDDTLDTTITFGNTDYAVYTPITAWPFSGIWCESTDNSSSVTIPQNNNDYFILSSFESTSSSTATSAVGISSITGGEALRLTKLAYSSYYLNEIYLIKNNKTSDITITFAETTTRYGFIGLASPTTVQSYTASTSLSAPYAATLNSSSVVTGGTTYDITVVSQTGYEGFAIELGQFTTGDYVVVELELSTNKAPGTSYNFGFVIKDSITDPASSGTYNQADMCTFTRDQQNHNKYKMMFEADPTKTYYMLWGLGSVSGTFNIVIDLLKVYTVSLT